MALLQHLNEPFNLMPKTNIAKSQQTQISNQPKTTEPTIASASLQT